MATSNLTLRHRGRYVMKPRSIGQLYVSRFMDTTLFALCQKPVLGAVFWITSLCALPFPHANEIPKQRQYDETSERWNYPPIVVNGSMPKLITV